MDQGIVIGLQAAARAEAIATSVEKAVTEGFREVKDNFRYDLLTAISNNNSTTKLLVLEALDEHHKLHVKPLELRIETLEDDAAKTRTQIETLKKASMWVWGVIVSTAGFFGLSN